MLLNAEGVGSSTELVWELHSKTLENVGLPVMEGNILVEYFVRRDEDRLDGGAFEDSIESHTYLKMEVQRPAFLWRRDAGERGVVVC